MTSVEPLPLSNPGQAIVSDSQAIVLNMKFTQFTIELDVGCMYVFSRLKFILIWRT